jgi:adenylylsulfate kinase
MITWITGNSQSGKTTLAKKLISIDGGILLDGDEMRSIWKLNFTQKDRYTHNIRVAKLAKILENQGYNIIVSTICPYIDLRKTVKEITNCRFIQLDGGKKGKNYPYEHTT